MYNLNLIGQKIKEIRKKKKISQESLAEMVEMNTRSILRIENAKTLPTLESLNRIASALDVDISDFFNTKCLKTKKEIITDINNCLEAMTNEELNMFYKSVYNIIH